MYKITFLDHFIGDADEMIFQAVGFYLYSNENFHIFSHWLLDSENFDDVEANLEPFGVIKGTVLSMEELKTHGFDH